MRRPRLRRVVSWTSVLLVGILVLGTWLRVRGLAWGLPYGFQNPDESVVIARAVRVARGHANPEFFAYPSLLFYVLGAVLRGVAVVVRPAAGDSVLSPAALVVDPSPLYVAGRILSASCGVISVYLVFRLGRETYGRAAGLLAALLLAVEPLHVRYSHVAVTDVPAVTLGLAALVLFARAARVGSTRLIAWGALAAGLATSTKYNLALLVVAAVPALWFALRDPARRRSPNGYLGSLAVLVGGPMLGGFLAGTPFAVLDPFHFLGDYWRVQHTVGRGWLGFEHAGNGYWYNLATNLAGSLGVVLLVVCLAGLCYAVWCHRRPDIVLVPYVLVYYLYVSSWHQLQDRYLLPIVPLLLLLASRLCMALARARSSRLAPASRRRLALATTVAAALVFAAALALPLRTSVTYVRGLRGDDTRAVAKTWIERHLPADSVVATDVYGPPLVPSIFRDYYRDAGRRPVTYHVVSLQLPEPGVEDDEHTLEFLRERGVRYVAVSSGVYDRVLAAPETYPAQADFYRRLGREAERLATFSAGRGQRGPTITVYEL